MDRIRRQQISYGTVAGSLAFVLGWGVAYFGGRAKALTPELGRRTAAAWVWLNANGVRISGFQALGFSGWGQRVFVVEPTAQGIPLVSLPILLSALAGLLVAEAIGGTRRLRYLVQNCGAAAIGYTGAGLLVVSISGARPLAGFTVILFGIGSLALALGTLVVRGVGAQIPAFAIVSLSGVFGIGLVVLAGSAILVDVLLPIVAVSLGGTQLAAVAAYVARNA